MKKINALSRILISTILILPFFLSSCQDCDLVGTTYPCRVREATVPQFDPSLQLNSATNEVTIVPTYNNQTFAFPMDNSSSGTLTNDNRYDSRTLIDQFFVIDSKIFTLTIDGVVETFRVQLVNQFAPNPVMVGDAMVVSVSNTFDYALVRFYGHIARFPQQFNFEDAYRFCNEYLPAYKAVTGDEEFTTIASQSTRFGSAIAFNNPNPVQNNIRILNQRNEDVTSLYLGQVPQNILNELGSNKMTSGIDVQVRVGDVFYYKARNGKEFAVIVSNIYEGSLDPNIRRVTLRFSELKGKGPTECKPTN